MSLDSHRVFGATKAHRRNVRRDDDAGARRRTRVAPSNPSRKRCNLLLLWCSHLYISPVVLRQFQICDATIVESSSRIASRSEARRTMNTRVYSTVACCAAWIGLGIGI
jgi:hypothetical protein